MQQLAFEKEALGLYWSGHPIDRVAAELKTFGAKTTADLATVAASSGPENGKAQTARTRRTVTDAQEASTWRSAVSSPPSGQLKTRKGDRMAVITLEDPHGSVEVVVFPEAYAKAASVLEAGAMVVVKGKVELDEEAVRMMANEVLPIATMREKMSRQLSIKLTSPPHGRATFEALADLFARHRGDRRVILELELRGPAREDHPLARARRSGRAGPSAALRAAVLRGGAHLRQRHGEPSVTRTSLISDAGTQGRRELFVFCIVKHCLCVPASPR